jgi:hypothetical protein
VQGFLGNSFAVSDDGKCHLRRVGQQTGVSGADRQAVKVRIVPQLQRDVGDASGDGEGDSFVKAQRFEDAVRGI